MITIGFKQSSDSWLRAILAIGLGIVVLITCFQKADPFALLVKVCACFVFAAGIFSVIYAFIRKNEKDFSLMMVNAAVDLVIGAVMFFFAGAISKVFFYLIAAVLIIFGLWQIIVLFSARKYAKAGAIFYVLPAIVIVLGALLLSPNIGKALGYICGASLILYGVTEICTLYKMRKAINAYEIIINPEPENVDVQEPDDQEQV